MRPCSCAAIEKTKQIPASENSLVQDSDRIFYIKLANILEIINNGICEVPDIDKTHPAEENDTGNYIGYCLDPYRRLVKDTSFEKSMVSMA